MSGHGYCSTCPMCGSTSMQSYTDTKPYDMTSHECLECGFYTYTEVGQHTLETVNELLIDQGGEPIKKLREQKYK